MMPYKLEKKSDGWHVINTDTGDDKGKSASRAMAVGHMRRLYQVESGAKQMYMAPGQIMPDDANYDVLGGTDTQACANCQFFDSPDDCLIVCGDISPTGICDNWHEQVDMSMAPVPVEVTNWGDKASAGPGGIKEWFTNLFNGKTDVAPAPVGLRPIHMTKDLDGRMRATMVFSNNFEDRHDQIIPEVVHTEYINWVERTKLYPEFQIWHLGTKSRWGQADLVTRVGHFTLASGLVDPDKEELAQAFADDSNTGISNGYYALYADAGKKEFAAWWPYEISALPVVASANVWMGAEHVLIGEGFLMKPEHKSLLQAKGLDGAFIDALEADILARGTTVEAAGVASKEVAVTEPVVAAAEPNDLVAQLGALIDSKLAPLNTAISELQEGQKALAKSEDDKIADTILARAGAAQGFKATEAVTNIGTPEGESEEMAFDWLAKDLASVLKSNGVAQ